MDLIAAIPESTWTLLYELLGVILLAVLGWLKTNKDKAEMSKANAELKADVQTVKSDLKANTEKTDLIAEEAELHTDLIEAAGGNTASSRSRIKAAKMRHVRPVKLPQAGTKTEIT